MNSNKEKEIEKARAKIDKLQQDIERLRKPYHKARKDQSDAYHELEKLRCNGLNN